MLISEEFQKLWLRTKKRMECVHCHAIKNKIKNHAVDKVKKLWYFRQYIKKTVLQVKGVSAVPNLRCLSKICSVQNYRAYHRAAMLEDILSPPIWWPENSINIWNLLWLSSWLVIWAKPKSFYTSTLPNT